MKIPYLPQSSVGCILIDCKVEEEIIKNLNNIGISVVKAVKCKELYEAVNSHPDMMLCPMGGKDIIVAPNVFDYYREKLTKLGLRIIQGNTILKSHYPYNIAYNICRVGNFVIHNFKYTDQTVMDYIEKKGLKKIQVSQGYAKCSVAIIGEKAMITSDLGIHREVIKYGIDSLLIEEGDILLPGLNYGFIGGCCGYIDHENLAFIGNCRQHKNYKEITKFMKKHKKNIFNLANGQLKDSGSIIPLMEMD